VELERNNSVESSDDHKASDDDDVLDKEDEAEVLKLYLVRYA
jgi:hypothetical protein